MSDHNSLVSTYSNHNVALDTLKRLQGTGFDMSKLYIVTQDEAFDTTAAKVVSDLNGLSSDQLSCIPRENIPNYEAELKADRLLLVTHGTPEEIIQARKVIDSDHPDGWDGNIGCVVYYGCND